MLFGIGYVVRGGLGRLVAMVVSKEGVATSLRRH